MTLDEWLTRQGMEAKTFAEQVGVDKATVGRWRGGGTVPRPRVMARIVAVTGGAVTANDFMGLAHRRPEDTSERARRAS